VSGFSSRWRQPRFVVGLCLTLLAIAIMARLGIWQLERMEEKSLRLASIAQKKDNGPLSLAALNTLDQDIQDYPVGVNGRVSADFLIYLDNQIENGRVGYQVLAPVITDAGQVLVNFGWVAATTSRQELPAVTLPDQLSNAEGVIRIPTDNPVIRETATRLDEGQLLLQQIDMAHVEQVTRQTFLPFVVQLSTPEDPRFVRNWQPVVMAPEKHLGYAIQWFGLAIAAAVIACVVFFSRGNAHVQTKQK